jgi:hypothetical protein
MTFPEAKFKHELRMNPNYSSFIIFGRMIEGLKMPKFYVGKWFLKVVDKKDYDEADVDDLIAHLCRRTMA